MFRPFTFLPMVVLSLGLFACGENPLASTEPDDPATSAASDLEAKRPTSAIKTLEKALVKSPGNPTFLSLLAAAYAQRAGIEPLSLAQNLASKNASSASTLALAEGSESLVALFDVMPPATEDSVGDIHKAVSILSTEMSLADWLPGDSFKFAIYQTASLVLNLKILDTNGDGALSLTELLNLRSGENIVEQLASAASLLSGSSTSSSASQVAALLASQKAAIDASEGASPAEKLTRYLTKSSGSNSTPSL